MKILLPWSGERWPRRSKMKTKFDLTQFEDNSDRTTCTVSVIRTYNVKSHLKVQEVNSAPEYISTSLICCVCVSFSLSLEERTNIQTWILAWMSCRRMSMLNFSWEAFYWWVVCSAWSSCWLGHEQSMSPITWVMIILNFWIECKHILLPEGGFQIVRWANLITQLVTFSDPPAGRRKFFY